jgi:antibiotic biosynthesis monooxygenase (ABM) superfamily enzyme
MHIMVVRMATDPDRSDEVLRHFSDDAKRRVSSRPGYIGGRWLLAEDRRHAVGVIRFDSAEAAQAAAIAGPRRAMADQAEHAGKAWNVVGVNVFEQVAVG